MPRNNRCVEAGFTYHVTQRGVNRQDVFYSSADRRCYLKLATANAADCEVRVLAWCLMSNHVHWIVEAGRPNSLAVFFRRVHGRYAQYLNARRGRNWHLWQNRFFSCPLGPSHLWRAVQYVEANPVRAGMVAECSAYPWSSAGAHQTGPEAERVPLLDWEFWQAAGGAAFWRVQMQQEQSVRNVRALHECTYSGKPFGDDAFVAGMEERFRRQWRPVGRPKARVEKREMGTEQSASFGQLQNRTGSG